MYCLINNLWLSVLYGLLAGLCFLLWQISQAWWNVCLIHHLPRRQLFWFPVSCRVNSYVWQANTSTAFICLLAAKASEWCCFVCSDATRELSRNFSRQSLLLHCLFTLSLSACSAAISGVIVSQICNDYCHVDLRWLTLVIGWPVLNSGLLVRAPALPVTLSWGADWLLLAMSAVYTLVEHQPAHSSNPKANYSLTHTLAVSALMPLSLCRFIAADNRCASGIRAALPELLLIYWP